MNKPKWFTLRFYRKNKTLLSFFWLKSLLLQLKKKIFSVIVIELSLSTPREIVLRVDFLSFLLNSSIKWNKLTVDLSEINHGRRKCF